MGYCRQNENMEAKEAIEKVKNGLRETFELGLETNKGFNKATGTYDFYSRILDSDFSRRAGIAAAHLPGILEILKSEGFIIGVSATALYSMPASATRLDLMEYSTVVYFPTSFKKGGEMDAGLNVHSHISFDPKTREIIYNDKVLLTRPRFNSTNCLFFEYIYSNPNKTLAGEEIRKVIKSYVGPKQVLRDLGFSRSLRKMFFPGASVDGVYFRNPITISDFKELKLSAKQLESDLLRLKKRRK